VWVAAVISFSCIKAYNQFGEMSGEKKLIEVFRTFFDKIVLPTVKNNDKVVSEWKYLNSLIS
jgi:hypothetical protein